MDPLDWSIVMASSENLSYMTFVATQAALKAGDILRKGFGNEYEITSKPGRQNIVTQYDKASEECIIHLIKHHFPTHTILAEESGLISGKDDSITWIIDPLDGTTNFAHHLPLFTISIAAYKKEKGLCGVIFQPLTNELFIAEKGRGAYLNGVRLFVSPTTRIEDSLIGAGFPYNIPDDVIPYKNPIPYMDHFLRLTRLGVTFRHLGSAALALAYVAAGKLDGFWIDHLHPWDLAAGKLLIEEAGGKLTRYTGKKHKIYIPSDIVATNQIIHNQMLININL